MILSILTVIFVIAKLMNIIAWSWWLVFLPSIIGGVIALLAMLLVVGLAATK